MFMKYVQYVRSWTFFYILVTQQFLTGPAQGRFRAFAAFWDAPRSTKITQLKNTDFD